MRYFILDDKALKRRMGEGRKTYCHVCHEPFEIDDEIIATKGGDRWTHAKCSTGTDKGIIDRMAETDEYDSLEEELFNK